ncbi:hypothetical protein PMIN01_13164 [Paraphaeosphaeria minitans]|uniref:Uncharacterized protein n=1 Tax=Paraphaeosphaeria minitans TaxID=565426 RepID=A0A9P6KJV2_9PLEO|nr:hypothetical protein PMIN01_13164 [Paraphaeosphaeria minitans]
MRPSHHPLHAHLPRRDVPHALIPLRPPLPRLPPRPLHLLLQPVQLLHDPRTLRRVRRRYELPLDEPQLDRRPVSALYVPLWILAASARGVGWDGVEDGVEAGGGGAPGVRGADGGGGGLRAEASDGRDGVGVGTRADGGRMLAWCGHKVSVS